MGNYIEDLAVNYISNSIEITEDEESVIRYGIKIIYYNSFKFLIVFLIALLLNTVSEVFTVFIIMATIRSFAFGFHANSSLLCLVISFINIFGVIYLSYFDMGFLLKSTLSFISFILFVIYAPADTEERPLVDFKKRKKFKILITSLCIIYIKLSYFVVEQLSNIIVLSLFFMAFNTCPILYIIFKKEYNNYEKYQ